jgi:hypothetical protein
MVSPGKWLGVVGLLTAGDWEGSMHRRRSPQGNDDAHDTYDELTNRDNMVCHMAGRMSRRFGCNSLFLRVHALSTNS